jgi:GNAT superfamily N-acetyltransferase
VAIVVREADLDRDLAQIADTVNASFGSRVSLARFRWLYLDNPDGRAVAWLAVDDRTGAPAGCTAVFPRRVRLGRAGRDVTAWNCGDFAILPRYRTLGVAVKLRRAARDGIDAGQSPFLYAHPNDRMLAVHLAVGHAPLGRMVRYARPLRLSTRNRMANRLSTAAFRLCGADTLVRRRHDVDLISGCMLPGDIDAIYARAADGIGTAVVRDRRYLEWRFTSNPEERTETVVTRERGQPTAYLVLSTRDEAASVKDWLGVDTTATEQVFAAFLSEMRRREARSVSATVLETHRDLALLRRLGFMPRPDVSMVVTYSPAAYALRADVADPAAWYMTVGDRDV